MAILTIDTCDPRDVKALQLAATADRWERTEGGSYRIPASHGDAVYLVTPHHCNCQDAWQGNVCKHRRAVAIHVALTEATAPASPHKLSEAALWRRFEGD